MENCFYCDGKYREECRKEYVRDIKTDNGLCWNYNHRTSLKLMHAAYLMDMGKVQEALKLLPD